MNFRKFRYKTLLTLTLVWTFLLAGLPVKAQIDLDSGGLLGGSRAFVFRKTSSAKQRKVVLKFAEAWFDLAVAYYNLGRESENGKDYFSKSKDAYEKARRFSSNDAQRRLNIDTYINVGEIYRRLAALETDLEAKRSYYAKAVGEYRVATTFIERKPELYDESEKDQVAEIYSDFGYVAGQTELNKPTNIPKGWTTTINTLKKAAEVNASAIDYTNLGWVYFNAGQDESRLGRTAEATDYYQNGKEVLLKALQKDQNFVPALLNLGIINGELKNFSGAVEMLEKALAISSEKSVKIIANNELGIAYWGQKDYDNAAKSFRTVLDVNPNFAPAIYNLGETEYQRKNKKEAQKMLEKLQQIGANYYYARLRGILAGAVLK